MKKYHQLLNFASNARKNAYAPYSHYTVGAAIEADNNKIYAGCNVENISYPCGTCAEESAISAMIADGAYKIKRILITAGGDILISPCGACRQRIIEFSDENTEILLADEDEIKKILSINELLPFSFKEFRDDKY